MGEKFDRAAMREIKTGGYAFIPKGSTMFGYVPDGAVVQVHGVGPFHIHWRAGAEWRARDQTLDDPGSASVFKFKKGDRVVGSRGNGRVNQGYFSGEILQYEIAGDDGALFMASEDELRRLQCKCRPLPGRKQTRGNVEAPVALRDMKLADS